MTKTVLSELIAERGVLVVDGATGTQLMAAGIEAGDAPERLTAARAAGGALRAARAPRPVPGGEAGGQTAQQPWVQNGAGLSQRIQYVCDTSAY